MRREPFQTARRLIDPTVITMKKQNLTLLTSVVRLGVATLTFLVFWGLSCFVSVISSTSPESPRVMKPEVNGVPYDELFTGTCLVGGDAPSLASDPNPGDESTMIVDNAVEDLGAQFVNEEKETVLAINLDEYAGEDSTADKRVSWGKELELNPPIEIPSNAQFENARSQHAQNLVSHYMEKLFDNHDGMVFVNEAKATSDGGARPASASEPKERSQTASLLPLNSAKAQFDQVSSASYTIGGGYHRHVERSYE